MSAKLASCIGFALATAVLCLAGCGSSSSNDVGEGTDAALVDSSMIDAAGSDAGMPDTGAPDTGTPDAGAPDTGAADTGITDAGPGPVDGGYFGSLTISGSNVTFIVSSRFTKEQISDDEASCAQAAQVAGSCCFIPPSSQDGGTPDAGTPPAPTYYSAGDIVFTNANTGATVYTDPWVAQEQSYGIGGWAPDYYTWAPGAAIAASAPGADVSAFNVSASGPQWIEMKTPWDSSSPLTISRQTDVVLQWQPDANSGQMKLSMVFEYGAAYDVRGIINCTVPDSTGTLTISNTLLQNLSAGDIVSSAVLIRTVRLAVTSGNAMVELRLTSSLGGKVSVQ